MNALLIAAGLLLPALLLAALLRAGPRRRRQQQADLATRIDALLPQTQCGQCQHPGCRPYAEAIAAGHDDINKCPPGGEAGIHKLAALLERPYLPFGPDTPAPKPRLVALIDEATCIGCTLCIQACPVDAIIGAAKQMHTVVRSECTGCELCLAPCPVDCIRMLPAGTELNNWQWRYPTIPIKRINSGTATP